MVPHKTNDALKENVTLGIYTSVSRVIWCEGLCVNGKAVLSYNNIKSVVIVIEKSVMKVKTNGSEIRSWLLSYELLSIYLDWLKILPHQL